LTEGGLWVSQSCFAAKASANRFCQLGLTETGSQKITKPWKTSRP
jgi:hypothetical protein